jgi:hypothetical protein
LTPGLRRGTVPPAAKEMEPSQQQQLHHASPTTTNHHQYHSTMPPPQQQGHETADRDTGVADTLPFCNHRRGGSRAQAREGAQLMKRSRGRRSGTRHHAGDRAEATARVSSGRCQAEEEGAEVTEDFVAGSCRQRTKM